jgi:hypothetical protein
LCGKNEKKKKKKKKKNRTKFESPKDGVAFGSKQRLAVATCTQPFFWRTTIAMGASDSCASRPDFGHLCRTTNTIRMVKKENERKKTIFFIVTSKN